MIDNGQDRQVYYAPTRLLVGLTGNVSAATTSQTFRVTVPDSRLRVKVSVLVVPAAGGQPGNVAGKNLSLWLCEAEEDRSGTSGILLPATNLEGTQAAPTNIPVDAGLGAYSREFVTAGDYIQGVLTIGAQIGDAASVSVVLQCRIQPEAGQRFTHEEWYAICASFRGEPVGPVQTR